jgi:hypothetical protein
MATFKTTSVRNLNPTQFHPKFINKFSGIPYENKAVGGGGGRIVQKVNVSKVKTIFNTRVLAPPP